MITKKLFLEEDFDISLMKNNYNEFNNSNRKSKIGKI
jgi:hypothetical protein